MKLSLQNISILVLIYGIVHALIDASCLLLILGGIDVQEDLLKFILLYNILAFGLQLPFGWILDRIQRPVLTAFLGCLLTAAALLLFLHPLAATVLAGTGNALFHVGGATVSLSMKPEKASFPGVFVAFGGVGLFAGGLALSRFGFHPVFFAILLFTAGFALFLMREPLILYKNVREKPAKLIVLAILLFLFVVTFRSAVGLAIDFPWKSNSTLGLMLTLGIALGKGLGGFIADRFGWTLTAVTGLAISSILIFFGSNSVAGITGMFLFNISMPVTLVAISNLLPGRPGFSFGLTTLALLLGSLPTFFNLKVLLSDWTVLALLAVLSTVLLFIGLKLYQSKKKNIL